MPQVLLAASAGSMILGGVGSLMQAKAQREAGKYNAAVMEQQAQAERESFKLYEYQAKKTTDIRIGEQQAAYAKSGVKFSGTPIDVMIDSYTNANLDLAIKKYNSDISALSYEDRAMMYQAEAKQKARMSTIEAGTSFLGGAIKAAPLLGIG